MIELQDFRAGVAAKWWPSCTCQGVTQKFSRENDYGTEKGTAAVAPSPSLEAAEREEKLRQLASLRSINEGVQARQPGSINSTGFQKLY